MTASFPPLLFSLLLFLPSIHSEVSSLTVDWSLEAAESPVRGFLLEYSPAVGRPKSGTLLPGHASSILINGTMPATEYSLSISALLADGSRHNVTARKISSSPKAPVFESVETTSNEATISFFPPSEGSSELSYNIEYHPLSRPEYSNIVDTRSSLVKLRGLEAATTYRLRITSVYKGARSTDRIETTFTTKEESGVVPVTIRTLPPNFAVILSREKSIEATTKATSSEQLLFPSGEIIIKASGEESTTIASTTSGDNGREVTSTEEELIATRRKILTFPTPSLTSSTIVPTIATHSFIFATVATESSPPPTTTTATTRPSTTTTMETTTTTEEEKEETTTATTSRPSTTPPVETVEEAETEFVDTETISTVESPSPLKSFPSLPSAPLASLPGFPDPGPISLSRTEDNMLRVEWESPEGAVCDSFTLNYTLLSLDDPKTLSASTNDDWVHIKMYTDHSIRMDVFCMVEGAASKTWWAHRLADLSRPLPVEGLRVLSSSTDEFYVATVSLSIDWPSSHDFDHYKIVVAYSEGKTLKEPQEIKVEKEGPIVISKLEATKWYTFSVKNVSVEMDVASAARGIREITPPIVSSQLSPGQISSTSININFDPSDPEQGKFDHYELVFSGNAKNITKKVGVNGARSFTFTKLIPGKTYLFELFTVFEGRRSRPVIANVTTYPLKVNQLFPIVGRDHVTLFWDIENFADNDCRFRLSYTGTAGNGHQSSSTVVLRRKNSYRFDKLPGDTYYTFTITVIMGMGESEAESESEMVTISIGGQPPRGLPLLQRHGTRELALQFDNDPNVFSEQNGEIENFAVIVSEDVQLGGDDYELHSWFEVKDDTKWKAYRTSPSDYNPFRGGRKKTASFLIGSDDCTQQRLDEPFCNGMLRANVDYFVKVRAYTREGTAMETDWVPVHGAASKDGEQEEKARRVPCHMRLNGCAASSSSKSSSFFQPFLTLLGLIVPSRFF